MVSSWWFMWTQKLLRPPPNHVYILKKLRNIYKYLCVNQVNITLGTYKLQILEPACQMEHMMWSQAWNLKVCTSFFSFCISLSTRWEPINPAPPVTKILMLACNEKVQRWQTVKTQDQGLSSKHKDSSEPILPYLEKLCFSQWRWFWRRFCRSIVVSIGSHF